MNKKDSGVLIYLFIFKGKMWFKLLIIIFYVDYSGFMQLYGKMNAHQFLKKFFIHKAFIFKVILFFTLFNETGFEEHYK